MTSGGVLPLALSIAVFSISHIVLALPPLRSRLVTWLGENTFRALYSALAFALLFWAALAYRDAPVIEFWYPPIGLKHLSLLIMPIASILLVAGLTTRGPSAIGGERRDIIDAGPVGIMKITRHPVMWAVALWGTAHLLANGDVASIILFGGITLLALIGAAAQDAKRRLQFGAEWQRFTERTSYLPLAALLAKRTRLTSGEIGLWRIGLGLGVFAVLLWLHPWLFAVNPLPL